MIVVGFFRSLKRAVYLLAALWIGVYFFSPVTMAEGLTSTQIKSLVDGTVWYDPGFTVNCSISGSASSSDTITNTDYAGAAIFNSAQLAAINDNKSAYQSAASQVDIPWQMIAVIHIRESGGAKANPAGGQGIYQFVDSHGGPYPEGPVSDEEFARQTLLAAQFIKNKSSGLTASSSAEVIKDTFFSYNGRAPAYIEQAKALGFTDAQGYEGSPYVVNKIDSRRDPAKAADKTWGQIYVDHGPIEYPARSGYGAFVMYAALSGISLSGTCPGTSSGEIGQRVVAYAQQELALWKSGSLNPNGEDYKKYTYGSAGNWCAYFASWIYKQAGYPITSIGNQTTPSVVQIHNIGNAGDRFVFHDSTDLTYTPKPGDLVIQEDGSGHNHVNIIISVDGDKFTVIGGNQGYSASDFNGNGVIDSDERAASDYNSSRVTQYILAGRTTGNTIGFVSPK